MRSDRPLVLFRPAPQTRERIFDTATWTRLNDRFDVLDLEHADERQLDAALPRTFAIIGQPDLPAERLRRATALRALLNVEGNFFPNVDYPTAFAQGIRVLGVAPSYVPTEGNMAMAAAAMEQMAAAGIDPSTLPAAMSQSLIERQGTPDDIARVALFCASDLSMVMTGSTLLADAGETI
jgi:hypothetical protein